MLITSKLEMDLRQPVFKQVAYAVQSDSNTRALEISLFLGSTPWEIPPGTTAAVSFRKMDLTSGLYDTLPDGSTKAVTFSGNTLTAILAPQVLTCAGKVDISIALYDSSLNRLGVFPILLYVSTDPSAGKDISNNYYYLSTLAAVNEAIGNLNDLQTEAKENLVAAINEVFAKGGGGGAGQPGEDGEDGGYYTPAVSQPNAETMQVSFSPSKEGMEDVQPVSVSLPRGPAGADGKDYVLTEDDKQKIAEIAAELVDTPDSGGNVDLTGYATEQWVKDGYQPKGEYALAKDIPTVPVKSVNGKGGDVQLSAVDVGARPSNWMPTAQEVGALPNTYTPPNQTAEQVGADPKGTAVSVVGEHNVDTDAHNDIRLELKALSDRLTAFFDSDDTTLDELSEIVSYITNNKSLIESITTSKVNVADIVNNLTTNVANKPLSAAQGVVLKGLIDSLTTSLSGYQPKGDYALNSAIPTKVGQLENDKGYLTEHQDISGKLDASALPTAINTALAQAKSSGEFDGEDGYTPIKGTDYFTDADIAQIVDAVYAKVADGSEVEY